MKKKLVVLTGAGISAESGMSTFRDADGLWNNYRVEDVATPEGFARNPQLVLDFYNDLHNSLQTLKPNYGHLGLAELEELFDVMVITQNVDNLHEAAGSHKVLHLHGELTKFASVRNPECPEEWPFGTEHNLKLGDKASDGSQKRPFIVWFGEGVPNIELAAEWTKQADIFLVIGTSLAVYPAAGLLAYVGDKTPVYLIDPKPVHSPYDHPIVAIQKGASEGMRNFVEMLKSKCE